MANDPQSNDKDVCTPSARLRLASFDAKYAGFAAVPLKVEKLERDLAAALDHIARDDKEIERLSAPSSMSLPPLHGLSQFQIKAGELHETRLVVTWADILRWYGEPRAEPSARGLHEAAQVAFDQQTDDPAPGDWNAACRHIAELLRSSYVNSCEPK